MHKKAGICKLSEEEKKEVQSLVVLAKSEILNFSLAFHVFHFVHSKKLCSFFQKETTHIKVKLISWESKVNSSLFLY